MSEKDTIFAGKVRQAAIFDFKELYRFLYMWLIDENYFVVEKTYSEKITPAGKEVEIEWDAKKKISDYFRFNLRIKWRILGMTDVEVEDNGKKLKLNKGNVEIRTEGVLEKDYENRWEKNPFLKFLRSIYDRYVIRTRIDEYESKIHRESDEFLAQAKAFLALVGIH